MKESKKRRRKQLGKLMAKFCSQPVNLPGAQPLMNPPARGNKICEQLVPRATWNSSGFFKL